MVVYLASPYSHPDPLVMQARHRQAVKAAAKIMQTGRVVFCPVAHSHEIGIELDKGVDHDFWMGQDLPMLDLSDELWVLMLDGWTDSRGVNEEIAYAEEVGIVTRFIPADPAREDEALPHPTCDKPPAWGPIDPPETSGWKRTNPKDALGSGRLPLHLVPPAAIAYASIAHLNGALKYGASNWRISGVRASIYIDAAKRHIDKWLSGEESDEEQVPHLSSVLACINILIDARECGKLVDDRPPSVPLGDTYNKLTELVAGLKERHASLTPRHYTIEDEVQA